MGQLFSLPQILKQMPNIRTTPWLGQASVFAVIECESELKHLVVFFGSELNLV